LLAALPQTQLIATHDLDFARALCPRAAVMAEGRLIADGPTATVLDDPRILDAAGLR
jgi:energy-coupling factor transporter ATP-binding protein EcfA2